MQHCMALATHVSKNHGVCRPVSTSFLRAWQTRAKHLLKACRQSRCGCSQPLADARTQWQLQMPTAKSYMWGRSVSHCPHQHPSPKPSFQDRSYVFCLFCSHGGHSDCSAFCWWSSLSSLMLPCCCVGIWLLGLGFCLAFRAC